MPQVTSPEQLFIHELQDMYYAENALTKVLPQLAREANDRELTRAFETHLKETKSQIANLERVFGQLGKRPEAHPCPGIEGIKKEHDEFVEEQRPSPQVLDMFLTGAASRTEHYEIAAYTGLIEKARALDEQDVVNLLDENLKEEKEALRQVESVEKKLRDEVKAGAL
jgi:ferritin-like metal-binding protein YciE